MKRNMLIVFAFLAVALLFVYLKSLEMRQFEWNKSTRFLHNDDEPFGCQLFDSLAKATLPNGYTVTSDDIIDLTDTGDERRALLMLGTLGYISSDDIMRLDSFVRRGNKLMIVSSSFHESVVRWGTVDMRGLANFDKEMLKESILKRSNIVKLKLKDETETELGVSYAVANNFISSMADGFITTASIQVPDTMEVAKHFNGTMMYPQIEKVYGDTIEDDEYLDDIEIEPIVAIEQEDTTRHYVLNNKEGKNCGENVVSAKYKVGDGEVHIVTNPLLFTNYGALDKDISKFLAFQLSQISDCHIYRIEKLSVYGEPKEKKVSPLYYMLGQRPLRWAVYLLLASALLFMVFTAKRRQRVIPPDTRPVNRNLQFVEMLGQLYYRSHDNRDMLTKKYTYFKEELRRKMMMDIGNEEEMTDNVRKLAQTTGLPEDDLAGVMHSLNMNTSDGHDDALDDEELQYLIDKMNNILKHI